MNRAIPRHPSPLGAYGGATSEPRLVVVAPACTGKTTTTSALVALGFPVIDPDWAMPPKKDELHAARLAAMLTGEWAGYSALWHDTLRDYLQSQPGARVVFAHSGYDARAVRGPSDQIAYLDLPTPDWLVRVRVRARQGTIDPSIAASNRRAVYEDPERSDWIRVPIRGLHPAAVAFRLIKLWYALATGTIPDIRRIV